MCKICDNYKFDNVGVEFNEVLKRPTVYFPSQIGNVPADEQFKFCPVCGRALDSKSEKPLTFGDLRKALQDHTIVYLETDNLEHLGDGALCNMDSKFDNFEIDLMFPENYPTTNLLGITIYLKTEKL